MCKILLAIGIFCGGSLMGANGQPSACPSPLNLPPPVTAAEQDQAEKVHHSLLEAAGVTGRLVVGPSTHNSPPVLRTYADKIALRKVYINAIIEVLLRMPLDDLRRPGMCNLFISIADLDKYYPVTHFMQDQAFEILHQALEHMSGYPHQVAQECQQQRHLRRLARLQAQPNTSMNKVPSPQSISPIPIDVGQPHDLMETMHNKKRKINSQQP